MEIKMPELEYGHIISHTFPGILLTFEIGLTFSLLTNINIFNTICSIDYKAINILFLFIILFVCSTIFGIILDCVHHFLFYHWEAKSENMKILILNFMNISLRWSNYKY
jgi:hypothetical protein